jgi:hypothetical protein
MELQMTFADFAATEARFLKQFKKAPPETWNDSMVTVADFLQLDKDEREGKFPFIWGVDKKNHLTRLLVTEDLLRSCEERLHFWRQLRGIAGLDAQASDSGDMAERIRAELLAKVSASLGLGGGTPAAAGAMVAAGCRAECRRVRRLRAGLDRFARMHGLRRVHQPGAEGLCLQRPEACRGGQSQGGEVRRHRQGRGKVHGRLHPPRHAVEHERSRGRETHGPGG